MSRFPGVGQRIRQRFKALGYWKDGRPDVGRFCGEKAYRPQYLYAWLADRIPSYDNLARLARDLEAPPDWILFGKGGASGRDVPDADGARDLRRGAQIIDFARLRDVTPKLVRLETELETIFRASPDLYFWLDTEGTVLAYEGSRGPDFDVPPELALGKKIVDVFPPEPGLRLETALRQSLDAPSPVSAEFTLGAKSYEARLRPLPPGGGARGQRPPAGFFARRHERPAPQPASVAPRAGRRRGAHVRRGRAPHRARRGAGRPVARVEARAGVLRSGPRAPLGVRRRGGA